MNLDMPSAGHAPPHTRANTQTHNKGASQLAHNSMPAGGWGDVDARQLSSSFTCSAWLMMVGVLTTLPTFRSVVPRHRTPPRVRWTPTLSVPGDCHGLPAPPRGNRCCDYIMRLVTSVDQTKSPEAAAACHSSIGSLVPGWGKVRGACIQPGAWHCLAVPRATPTSPPRQPSSPARATGWVQSVEMDSGSLRLPPSI